MQIVQDNGTISLDSYYIICKETPNEPTARPGKFYLRPLRKCETKKYNKKNTSNSNTFRSEQ